MSGLRNQKNTLRNSIYELRDELITGIEDKIIDEEKQSCSASLVSISLYLSCLSYEKNP